MPQVGPTRWRRRKVVRVSSLDASSDNAPSKGKSAERDDSGLELHPEKENEAIAITPRVTPRLTMPLALPNDLPMNGLIAGVIARVT